MEAKDDAYDDRDPELVSFSDREKRRVRWEVPPWVDSTKVPAIFPAMIKANREIEAVTKSRKNTQQNYSFRGIDQVYDMIHSVLADAGIVTVPVVLKRITSDQKSKSGSGMALVEMEVEYWCYSDDGSALVIGPIWSEALDISDKATNKALAFAQKYALLQTFTIPTSDVAEGDQTTHERGQQQYTQPAAQQQRNAADQQVDLVGADTAAKVYAGFGAFGVTQAQINKKLDTSDVAKLPHSVLDQLMAWRDEIVKDKRAAERIFGQPATQSRADALNAPKG